MRTRRTRLRGMTLNGNHTSIKSSVIARFKGSPVCEDRSARFGFSGNYVAAFILWQAIIRQSKMICTWPKRPIE